MPASIKTTTSMIAVLMLVVGCGGVEPTSTALPPSATPVPPTETPTAATETPAPPAATEKPFQPTATSVPSTATATLAPTATPEMATSGPGFLLEGVGLRTPESVLHDPETDLYLVTNISGGPATKDGDGFISQVSPDGALVALKWIDGMTEGVTLDAPKGMALSGDSLYVADIDVVRIFDRQTGNPRGAIEIPGASFLNDVSAAENGTVYVTDSATGAVHRIGPDRSVEQVAQLEGPNGIQVRDEVILVAAGRQIYQLSDGGLPIEEYEVPAGGLDGLILLEDGTVLVSSWEGSAVYLLDPAGTVSELLGGIPAPADIGFDKERGYILIPHFKDDRLEARPLAH